MKVYIAGPMTGLPQFNFPAFDEAAAHLRATGFDVVSPAELDDPEDRAAALASPDGAMHGGHHMNKTWGDFLARDVKLLADGGIEAVFVLPGWQGSSGARLETFVASAIKGMPVFAYGMFEITDGGARVVPFQIDRRTLVEAWAKLDLEELLAA